ncbi:MAG: serine/threonine protein kinase [Planctomycetaceae bacterium]|nr:serine/threonine protein kinase [Planctomycetaceae bacterium]
MHPDQIGPYRIDRRIGAGGMGNVYHGVHRETNDEVAVKVLPASMAREDGFVQRFSREIESLQKLSSPNIVRFFDSGMMDDGSYYFAMEYVAGETLTSVISNRRRIPWPEVIDISLQIAQALKAAHNAGIIHRDLKPSNLMIRSDGVVKLADFGVAHVFATTRLTRTGGVVGTAEYMSPEQARGQRASRQSDLYSLGAVMYVMLTGRPPFTGQTAAEILHRHQFSQFDRPSRYVPEIPRLLEDFVCTLLEKKPEKRFPDALVVINKLQQIRSRIEFGQQSVVSVGSSSADGDIDRTLGGTSDCTQGAGGSSQSLQHVPGAATIVRDAIRAEIVSQSKKGPVAAFFDNTIVLVLLLVLVIGAGIYLSQLNRPDANQELTAAVERLSGPSGPAWIRIRDDVLTPALQEGRFPDRRAELEGWVRKVDQYEFCRSLEVTTAPGSSEETELFRLVRLAFDKFASGHVPEAQMLLSDVLVLIRGDDEYEFLRSFLTTTMEAWEDQKNTEGRRQLIQNVLSQIRSENQNRPKAVDQLRLQSLIRIYENDSAMAPLVDECRQLLKSVAASGPESE